MEIGSYWNGEKQAWYTSGVTDSTFWIVCGNNISNIYTCLQQKGVYQTLQPAGRSGKGRGSLGYGFLMGYIYGDWLYGFERMVMG
ncbi:hypothetical protein BV20DRAFT_973930 [Pilatotrama ljubarskyi]|nr:hypothetical protein BV20DRAFT_973930 [Pilatotrama ljubarskyi]